MPELSYSDDALNVRNAFFGAKVIVYVEGDDDVLFWHEIFSQVADDHFEVEPVGGAPALDEYICKIEAGRLSAIAARDADFLPLTGSCCPCPRVLYTYGYAVENSLYITEILMNLARSWCKTHRISVATCQSWLDEFAKGIASLVHLDIANTTSSAGVQTIGDNCTRFMKSANSATVCPTKVAKALALVAPKIPRSALSSAETVVGSSPDLVLRYLRGHALASAIHRFVVNQAKTFGRKVSISAESLYAAAIAHFSRTLKTRHPHRTHYLNASTNAWKSI
jgi:hypothetical protein